MQQAALTQADEVFDQVVEWLEHFEALDAPRQSGKVMYPLDEMLLLALVGVLAGAEGWVEVAAGVRPQEARSAAPLRGIRA